MEIQSRRARSEPPAYPRHQPIAVVWGARLYGEGKARPADAMPAPAALLSVEEKRAMLAGQIAQLEKELAVARAELETLE